MTCYLVIMVKDFYQVLSVKNDNLLSNVAIRNTVVMLVFSQTYVIVFHHCNYFLAFSLVPVFWQWLKIRFFYFFKQLPSAIAVSYTHLRAHETRHDLVC